MYAYENARQRAARSSNNIKDLQRDSGGIWPSASSLELDVRTAVAS